MFKQKRLTVLSMAVLLALLVAAVLPVAALAQDDTPPPTEAPVVDESVPPVDEAAPSVDESAPPVDEAAPPADESAPPAEAPASDAPAEDLTTVSEIMAEVPAGTDVVVLDAQGETLPLASVEAAETLAAGDPWFDSGGGVIVGYNTTGIGCPPIVTSCNASATPIQAAVNAYAASGTAIGSIFVEAGNYVEDVTIDGTANLSYLANNLTGIFGVGSYSSGSVLDGYFEIKNMTKDFTLAGFNVTDNNNLNAAVYTHDNAGTLTLLDLYVSNDGGAGIDVTQNGNVLVDAVFSVDNNGNGTVIKATGDVTVRNSEFSGNNDTANPGMTVGLGVYSDGDVYLRNVRANDNQGDGVEIDKTLAGVGPTSVYIKNSTFNYNTSSAVNLAGDPFGDGLWMDNVQGDVTLNNVIAKYNSNNGVSVGSASRYGVTGNGTTGNIYVNGGTFAYNGIDGLNLNADGNITLNSVNTYANGNDGAELCAGGDVYVNGGNYYWNDYGTNIRCAQSVYSYYGNWWGNDWWGYYWNPSYWGGYYYGYYGNYWDGWAFPIWGGPHVTINNIYVDGYFIPDYYEYDNFYNSYYYGLPYYGWGWWDWDWEWEPHYHGYWYWYQYYQNYPQPTLPLTIVTTKVLTEAELPGALPAGETFADAFELTTSGGVAGDVTKASFTVPTGVAAGATFTVLSWDGTTWTTVPSTIVDGKVVFDVSASGTFALATP